MRSRALIIFFALFTAFTIRADNLSPEPAQHAHSTLEALASDPQWLALLHYQRIGVLSSYGSQVDDKAFFLSPEGNHDPLAELTATVHALQTQKQTDSPAIHCRFPARVHWLRTQLPHLKMPESPCEDFDRWRAKIDAHSLTLVFPAAYLNSPSSMFGHTFIRINRNKKGNPLLDYSVNFAAEANPSVDQFSYAYKGLTGGYPGRFSVMPYYQKVNEYSFLESRDVWEYPMNLSQAEVDQFVRHIWELREIDFDYYFFSENCSYQLLTALDAANASWGLSRDFRFQAIPVDTVRSLRERNLLQAPQFRPSALTRLRHWQRELGTPQFDRVTHLIDPEQAVDDLRFESDTEQARMLEYSYHLLRYLAVKEKLRAPAYNERAVALLSKRSKLGSIDSFSAQPRPTFSDDLGHGSHRVGIHYGNYSNEHGVELSLRPAYHDLLDPIAGFIEGAVLEMFHLKLRYLDTPSELDVQSLTLINILSLSESDAHISPLSWGVSAGFERSARENDRMLGRLKGNIGKTVRHGNWQVSALWELELLTRTHRSPFLVAATGPRLALIRQRERYSFQLAGAHLHRLDELETRRTELEAGLAVHLSRSYQVRLAFEHWHQKNGGDNQHDAALSFGVNHYF